jgi:hypothetical protein
MVGGRRVFSECAPPGGGGVEGGGNSDVHPPGAPIPEPDLDVPYQQDVWQLHDDGRLGNFQNGQQDCS